MAVSFYDPDLYISWSVDFVVFSSPEQKAQDELLRSLAVRCQSVCPSVYLSTPLNNFSETSWQIFFKLHVEPSVKVGLKICTNGHSLLIKMAAMPVWRKNTKTSSSPEPPKLLG